MQIVLIKKETLYKYPFPDEFISSYWINDYDEFGNERKLVSVEKEDNSWVLISNNDCQIIDNNNEVKKVNVVLNKFYFLKIRSKNSVTNAIIYACNENDAAYETYLVQDGEFTIGSASDQNIIMNSSMINKEHAILIKNNDKYTIRTKDINFGLYVNGKKEINKSLENGDIIFIMGYKIIVLNSYIIINSYGNSISFNTPKMQKSVLPQYNKTKEPPIDDENAEIYTENDYYSRAPRFVTSILDEDFRIDSPPGKVEPDDTPVLYTVGPMLTMSMSSMVTATTSVINLMNGKTTFWAVFPALLVAVAMLGSTLLWPSLLRRFQRKKQLKHEEERQRKYSNYLTEKKIKIENLRTNQFQILSEKYQEPKNLEMIILNKKRYLWERQIKSDDFLNVRLGLGIVPLKIKLNYSKEDFTMVSDNLKDKLEQLVECSKEIKNAPVTISLTERNKLVLIGEKYYKESMLKSILLQLVTYQAYDELKLVLMVNDKTSDIWDDLKILPHMWSNARDVRFYANNYEDMSKISFYLEQVFMSRKYTEDSGKRVELNLNYKNTKPYYLIVVDNIKKK